MILVNTETIPGRQIDDCLGMVKGNTIRAKHIGKDILAGFRTVVGGEMKEYTEMMTEARQVATARMIEDAKRLDADAVVNIRFTTANVMDGCAEILAFGTAVKLAPKDSE